MPIQAMDIKEIKTQGFERVIHGYHEPSNFSAYIAIHTLKNGPAFGGVRIWNYRDNQKPYLEIRDSFENSFSIYNSGICLPSYPGLKKSHQKYIIKKIILLIFKIYINLFHKLIMKFMI